ncbi:SusC/RagA family TonB-linked outer membrane protein [Bacteroidia bacterium]|nr:SusC/RagA family TonB-linked outer membrane protein [Bacteroidia bacterium]
MNIKMSICLSLLLSVCFSLTAQQRTTYTIEGTVVDETSTPMPGVVVYTKDKITLGTSTDIDGKFSLKSTHGDMLVFSFVGFDKQEYLVTSEQRNLQIQLVPTSEMMEEVMVVGRGSTQRKISSVAAVTSVSAKELQLPTPSVANMLGGKVAGIITMQSSGEPGKNLAEFWVRGIGTFGANSSALVLIDGLEGNINSIDPADIESFSVLKDASATAVYGVRGANGVVLITTKRGEEGKLRINVRSNWSLSHLTRLPEYLRAYDYAQLANEAYEVRGEPAKYSNVELNVIRDGLDPDLYPDVSWQDEMINRNSFKQAYYASARGGGSIARYFVSLGLSDETAAYKVEKDNPAASNTGYKTYSFRSNLDINLTKSTVLYFGSEAYMSINNLPGQINTDYIWQSQASLTPLLFPVRYSTGQLPASGSSNGSTPPSVLINHTGKSSIINNSSLITLALNQDLAALTQGLTIRLQGAYNRWSYLEEHRSMMPALYRATTRNSRGNLVMKEQRAATNVSYSKSENSYRKYHFESTLNYDRAFADHRVGGLIYYYISDEQKTEDALNSLTAIPVRYQGVSSRLTYGFRDTYLLDVNFGYTGSENFMPGKQYGFFPSIALGWVPTSYEWVKNNIAWLDFFKIRGSYGTVGNDRIANYRFPYLTRVATGTGKPWGMASSLETVTVSQGGADNLMWEKALKSDIGVDVRLLNDRILFTVDYFNDQRDGIFQQRVQVPDYVGLTSREMPYGNVGKMRSWGSDGNISFRQDINKQMSFTIRANYTYSHNEVQNWEEAIKDYPYQELSGKPYWAVSGLQSLGFFKDADDVKYSPKQTFGEVMPGDLKYKDINGDGKIDSDDKVPLSNRAMYPLLMYGVGGEFNYKNLTFGILFKGTGQIDYFRNNLGYIPFYSGESGNIPVQFNDPSKRWIPKDYALVHGIDPALAENPNATIPRLQYGNNTNNSQLSDFWKGDARYLRLQEVTLNYNLRVKALQKIGISSLDLQLVGNNLWVWDKVKIFDPEQADKSGTVYPIPAVYTFQVYINL